MIAQQVGGKATRDALFLSNFAPEDLPRIVIAAAVASLLAVYGASRAFARFGPARVVPLAFAANAALYALEWSLEGSFARPVAALLYLHTATFGALVISGFWSIVNERFDPHTAKHLANRIGAGATFGGVLGGLLAERMGAWSDASAMLAALAALNALAALASRGIGQGTSPAATTGGGEHALTVLRQTPYLRDMAALVLLTAVSAGLVDYAFKAEAARHYRGTSAALLSFFAIFHTATAVLSFLLQAFLTKPALARLGVPGSATSLPVVVLMCAGAAALVPRFFAIVFTRGAELIVANSIFRSGYELLYTPVAPERKRPTKALIDVAGNRLGDALGSALVIAVLAFAPAASIALVLASAALVAILSLLVARRLQRGYVDALEEHLMRGTPIDASTAFLHATLQTLSTLGIDRETLIEQLPIRPASREANHAANRLTPVPALRDPAPAIDAPDDDPVHEKARTLRSGETADIRALLEEELDLRLVPFAIALLARRDVHHDAIAALRKVAERSIPALASALLDPDQPFAIRRRLPRVLEVCERPEAIEALDGGLGDARFEVRYRCALALSRILRRAPHLGPLPIERVHEVVRHELETGRRVWNCRRLLDEDDEDAPLVDRAFRDRVHRSIEHVFTVLSLAYDPEPLRFALIALAGEDRSLRGTALEYLETILPDAIRERLFPLLDARVELRTERTREQVREELIRSMQNLDARSLAAAIAKDVSAARPTSKS